MKSLERRFNNIARDNPFWSSHTCFAEAIRGQKFTKRVVIYYFNKLVEKDDYDRADKRKVAEYLLSLAILSENTVGEGMI